MIDFSRISHTSFLGKILRLPLSILPRNAVLPILQGSLRGKKWIAGSGNHGYWLGTYELEKRRVFESAVHSGSVVFDIGAHVGFYTLLASELAGDEGQVFAFEPAQQNLLYLKKHLRMNDAANVTVIEAAVSDKSGEVFFDHGESNSFTGHISDSGKPQTPSVALDELFNKGQIPAPDYIKIDVEGAEMQVLSGAETMLVENYPTLFLATHGREVHKLCCDFLGSLGYQMQPLDGESLDQSEELLAYWRSQNSVYLPRSMRL